MEKKERAMVTVYYTGLRQADFLLMYEERGKVNVANTRTLPSPGGVRQQACMNKRVIDF